MCSDIFQFSTNQIFVCVSACIQKKAGAETRRAHKAYHQQHLRKCCEATKCRSWNILCQEWHVLVVVNTV